MFAICNSWRRCTLFYSIFILSCLCRFSKNNLITKFCISSCFTSKICCFKLNTRNCTGKVFLYQIVSCSFLNLCSNKGKCHLFFNFCVVSLFDVSFLCIIFGVWCCCSINCKYRHCQSHCHSACCDNSEHLFR